MGGASIRADYAGYSLSGISASATGSAINLRASNGNFMLTVSAGTNIALGSALASATLQPKHSFDLTAWTNLGALLTASAHPTQTMLTGSYSAGAYGYVRVDATAVFSAAQTGTAVIWAHIQPGVN